MDEWMTPVKIPWLQAEIPGRCLSSSWPHVSESTEGKWEAIGDRGTARSKALLAILLTDWGFSSILIPFLPIRYFTLAFAHSSASEYQTVIEYIVVYAGCP